MLELIKYAVLAGAFVVCAGSRRWCLPVLAAFLPLAQWMPDIPIPGVNTLNLLLLPVLVRAVTAGPPPESVRKRDPLLFPMMILTGLFLISWVRVQFADVLPTEFLRRDGLYNNAVELKEVITAFLIYFSARRLTRDREDMHRAFGGVLTGYLFEAFTASKEFLFSGSWRATGHMGQPNRLGHFLAGYVMIPFGFFLTRSSRYWMTAGPAILLSVLGMMGAVSRGAILAAGIAVLLVGLVRKSPWVIVAAVVIGTAPLWLPDKVMDRFDHTVILDRGTGVEIDTTEEGRTEIWATGLSMIADNPFGVGLGQFPYTLPRYGYQGRHLRSSHNILIQLAAEEGILAAMMHLFIVGYLGMTAFALSKAGRDVFERAYGVAMIGVVLSFGCSTMFADGFYENILSGPYWLLAGMLVNLKIRAVAEPDGELQAGERPREE